MAPNCSMTMASGPAEALLKSKPVARERLGHLARLRVEGEQADRAVAVREEVDRVAHPQRIAVVRVVARDLRDAGVAERGDPDRRRLAAAIALPGGLPLFVRDVGQPRAVGREGRAVGRPAAAASSGTRRSAAPCRAAARNAGSCSPRWRRGWTCRRASNRRRSRCPGDTSAASARRLWPA